MAAPGSGNFGPLGRNTVFMLESFPFVLFVGTILGFLSALGVGGGSLLILWLTLIVNMDHNAARLINLLFFIPSAIVASVFRWKQGVLEIKRIMRWVGASNCDMEKGELRVDVNVSLRPVGQEKFGTRTELKNLNSFKAVRDALIYEINRQTEVLNAGGEVKQETRLWDKVECVSKPMRSKEDSLDYRYFPEPDLPPVVLTEEWLARVKAQMPEMPASKEARFMKAGLSAYDAGVLTSSRELADYFETVTQSGKVSLKTASNWIQTDLLGMLHAQKKEIEDSPISAAQLAELLEFAESGKINRKQAREVFDEIYAHGGKAADIIAKRGMVQVSDEGQLEAWAKEAMAANPKAVADYQKGNKAAIGALVGGVMKLSKGKANPKIISQLLAKLLG